MKTSLIMSAMKRAIFAITLAAGSFQVQAQDTANQVSVEPQVKKNSFQLSMGLLFSSGYKDALQRYLPQYEVTGGGGWVDIEAGFAFPVAPKLSVIPKLGLLAMRISYGNPYGLPASEKATVILMPGVRAHYELGGQRSKFFVGGELSLVSPASDLSEPELESGGLAYGLAIGYAFAGNFEIELNYRHVPVKVGTSYSYWSGYDFEYGSEEDANFGGVGLTMRRLFRF